MCEIYGLSIKIFQLVLYYVHLNSISWDLPHRNTCPWLMTLSILKSSDWRKSVLFSTKFEQNPQRVNMNYYFFIFACFFPLCVEKHNSSLPRNSLSSLSIVLINLSEMPVSSLVTAAILMSNLCSFSCLENSNT